MITEQLAGDPWYEIARERTRQDEKWGVQEHDELYWLATLSEELGEVATECLNLETQAPSTALEIELRQVAAVAIAWLEMYERRRKVDPPGEKPVPQPEPPKEADDGEGQGEPVPA